MENNETHTVAIDEADENLKVALLRLPAFLIDFVLVVSVLVVAVKLAMLAGVMPQILSVYWFMFLILPIGFFVYWSLNINIGKRIFRLRMVDASTGATPTVFQYFRRCLVLSLVVSLNLVFLIPLFVSKRNQGFQDMLANTLVVRHKK